MSGQALRWRWLAAAWPPVVTFVLLTLLAEVLLPRLGVNRALLPRPSEVLATGWRERASLGTGLLTTAAAAMTGFGLSAVLGVTLAVGLSASRWVQRAFYPYAVFFQTVPIIAIAPLLVIWLGAGYRAVAVSAFIVSVFPVIANTLNGLLSTDPALRDLFRLYGGSAWETLWKLRLPGATPQIVTGLRIASGLAVIGAIVGEFVAGTSQQSQGLGLQVLVALARFRTDLVFAIVLTASALGLAMFAAVNLLGWLLLRRWHASAES